MAINVNSDINYVASMKVNGKKLTQPTGMAEKLLYAIGWTDADIAFSGLISDTAIWDNISQSGYTYAVQLYQNGVTDLNFSGNTQLEILPHFSGISSASATTVSFSGCTNLKYIPEYDIAPASLENCFKGCTLLKSVNLYSWKTSSLTSLNSVFYGCTSIETLDTIEGWNVSAVTDFYCLFRNAGTGTDLDLSGWSTARGTDFRRMFAETDFTTLNISGFNFTSITSGNYLSRLFDSATIDTLIADDLTFNSVGNTDWSLFNGDGGIADVTVYGYTRVSGSTTPSVGADIISTNGPLRLQVVTDLPEGYERIDYVEGRGLSMIHIGNIPECYIALDACMTGNTANAYVLGSEATGGNYVGILGTGTAWSVGGCEMPYQASARTKMGITLKNGDVPRLRVDSFEVAGLSATTNTNWYLFSPSCDAKVYGMTVYGSDRETVLLDLVPCRRLSDLVYGFWDKESETFISPLAVTTTLTYDDNTTETVPLTSELYNSIVTTLDNQTVTLNVVTGGTAVDNLVLKGSTPLVLTDASGNTATVPDLYAMSNVDNYRVARGLFNHYATAVTFTGSETGWSVTNGVATIKVPTTIDTTYGVKCSHFASGTTEADDTVWLTQTGSDWYFNFKGTPTASLSDWQTWLAARRSTSVKPFVIVYQLGTSSTEAISQQTNLEYQPLTKSNSWVSIDVETGSDSFQNYSFDGWVCDGTILSSSSAPSMWIRGFVAMTEPETLVMRNWSLPAATNTQEFMNRLQGVKIVDMRGFSAPNLTNASGFNLDSDAVEEFYITFPDTVSGMMWFFKNSTAGNLNYVDFGVDELNVSSFDSIFRYQPKLAEVNTVFRVKNVSSFDRSFKDCQSLEWIDLRDWKQGNIDFSDCPRLLPETIYNLVINTDGSNAKTVTIANVELLDNIFDKYPDIQDYLAEYQITITTAH